MQASGNGHVGSGSGHAWVGSVGLNRLRETCLPPAHCPSAQQYAVWLLVYCCAMRPAHCPPHALVFGSLQASGHVDIALFPHTGLRNSDAYQQCRLPPVLNERTAEPATCSDAMHKQATWLAQRCGMGLHLFRGVTERKFMFPQNCRRRWTAYVSAAAHEARLPGSSQEPQAWDRPTEARTAEKPQHGPIIWVALARHYDL